MSAFSTSSPKYQQLAERFRGQIEAGTLRLGDRLPSLKEMYEEGISRPTVEKAYHILEREGYIERRRGFGVFVREQAARSTQYTIGLSGKGFNFQEYSPYWAHLLGGVREAASQAGMQLLLLDAHNSRGWEKADGVLVCDWNDWREPRKQLPGMPYVSLMAPIPGLASACADDESGARQATEHLLQLGHERIGFLHTYGNDIVARNRLKGYRAALQEAGVAPRKDWKHCLCGNYIFGKQFTDEARRNMRAWLQGDWKKLDCTALLCHNDEAAMGVIAELEDAGMRVPDDISVVGFDGTEYCELVRPQLSSVEIPLREIGAAGIELLIRQIEAEEMTDEHRMLNVELRVRQSTAAPPRH
jgi:DNA-binding LacI/PurR family transcriptional regulator